MPLCIDRQNKPRYAKRAGFQATHADPRRLLVKLDNPIWNVWLLVLHAPHSGHAQQEREEWWKGTQNLMNQYKDNGPLVALMDASAPPGEADGLLVIQTMSTPLLRQFYAFLPQVLRMLETMALGLIFKGFNPIPLITLRCHNIGSLTARIRKSWKILTWPLT